MFNNLYVEKYRPKTLSDLVLSDSNRKYFESITDEIPNLLFVGTPGLGKTTLARILVNDVLECQYLYINASDENGIDTIRSKVVGFSQTKSLDGKHKVVVLDECLDENTLVHVLRDGVKCKIPIRDLDHCNDLVKSYNQVSDRVEYRPFNHFYMGEQDCYEVEFENNEKIICTGSHKWYVKDEKGNIVRMKLDDIISKGIKDILTKSDNITTDNHK
jgi:Cdc6-like AAA superfamily ATPase